MTLSSPCWVRPASFLAVAVGTQTASAQTVARCGNASDELLDGINALAGGDADIATRHLACAMDSQPSPAAACYLGLAYEHLGRFREAADAYRTSVGLAVPAGSSAALRREQERARDKAQRLLAGLEPRIPRVTVSIDKVGSGAVTLRLDDAPLDFEVSGRAMPLDPGSHRLEASCGKNETSTVFSLAEGEAKQVPLRLDCTMPGAITVHLKKTGEGSVTVFLDGSALTADAVSHPIEIAPGSHELRTQCGVDRRPELATVNVSEERTTEVWLQLDCPLPSLALAPAASLESDADPPWWRNATLGWVGIGVGAAGVALGSVAGAWAWSKHDSLEEGECSKTTCPHSLRDEVGELDRLRWLSTAGFILGGVGVAGGLTVLELAHREQQEPTALSLGLTPGMATLNGAF